MELWIRSQDKMQLIHNPKLRIQMLEKYWYILDNYDFDRDTILGKYNTLERAIEVLDEIQNILIGKFAVSLNYKDAFSKGFEKEEAQKILEQMVVYQMPKE